MKKMKAIQAAIDYDRQIEFTTTNGGRGSFQVTSKSGLNIFEDDLNVTKVTLYPKGYREEYFKPPGRGNIIYPKSIENRYIQ